VRLTQVVVDEGAARTYNNKTNRIGRLKGRVNYPLKDISFYYEYTGIPAI
jgi:hypothetical protein